jgi:hypothetical protein
VEASLSLVPPPARAGLMTRSGLLRSTRPTRVLRPSDSLNHLRRQEEAGKFLKLFKLITQPVWLVMLF